MPRCVGTLHALEQVCEEARLLGELGDVAQGDGGAAMPPTGTSRATA
jgi:hypothetical protein